MLNLDCGLRVDIDGRHGRVDELQRRRHRRHRRIIDAVWHYFAMKAAVGRIAVDYKQQETRDGDQDTGSHQTERRQLFG